MAEGMHHSSFCTDKNQTDKFLRDYLSDGHCIQLQNALQETDSGRVSVGARGAIEAILQNSMQLTSLHFNSKQSHILSSLQNTGNMKNCNYSKSSVNIWTFIIAAKDDWLNKTDI